MRMFRTAVLAALCAATAAAQDAQPLDATLRRGVGEPFFWVSQPAYVAVFEVIPGLGVEQVFPRSTYQSERQVEPGEYLLSRAFRSYRGYRSWNGAMPYARPVYLTTGAGAMSSYYYTTAWSGNSAFGQRRTFLLVASRTPLRLVRSPESAQHWLQQVAGFRAISNTVYASEDMLTDIVDAVMPIGARVDDVVVDVLDVDDTFWEGANRWAGRSISFVCYNGVYSMPAEFFFGTGVFFCPTRPVNQTAGGPVTPGTPAPPPTPTGDEEIKVPWRKRPIPGNGLEADRRGDWGQDIAVPRSTVGISTGAPVTYGGGRGGVNPATGAWVPPTPSGSPGDYGYGAGRFTPAGTATGSGSSGSGGTAHQSSGTSSSGGSAPGSGAASGSSSAASSGTAAQAAQAARSAESRAAVQAARPPRDP